MEDGAHKQILCNIRYYLHYGFKISMRLYYNTLLVTTLLTWLLNIFVCVLSLMTLFYVFSKNMSLLLLKIYEVVAIFKCIKHSKR